MTRNRLNLPPSMTSASVARLFDALEIGGKVRFVGGCVRDAILKHNPKDIDIAVSLPPEAVMDALQKHDIPVVPTGLKHGTVTAVLNRTPYEITALRRDVACDGRHAEVEFTSDFREDAARRDFTFNAMFCTRDGTLYDYFGGRADLERGIVRFVGDPGERISEDYLRILRYFRFFARYGKGPMDTKTLAAITERVPSLETLSGERIQNEMFRILPVLVDSHVLEVMHDTGVLSHIALPCAGFRSVAQLMMLEMTETPLPEGETHLPILARLACLIRTNRNKKAVAHEVAKRWKLANQDKALLYDLVEYPDSLADNPSVKQQKALMRAWGKERFCLAALVAWAELLASARTPEHALSKVFSHMLKLVEEWEIPVFPVSGKDMIALGITPGKALGALLSEAETWWESQEYQPDKQAILSYVRGRVDGG